MLIFKKFERILEFEEIRVFVTRRIINGYNYVEINDLQRNDLFAK